MSVSTTSVKGILSTLSAALFTTIVPTRASSRGPKPIFGPQAILGPEPIFGAGCAHLELVPVRATVPASPRELRIGTMSGYRTDPSISFDALNPTDAPRARLHKAFTSSE